MTNPESTTSPYRYDAALAETIESKWQQFWAVNGTFETPDPEGEFASEVRGEKFFVMDMFPYPSGAGLHVGHPLGYIATDVVGRFKRMQGFNVLHPLGYDAFGLPAEQYAVQTGQHPRITTEANIENMRRQLRRLGLAHDPRRSFATIDPDFVKWTQWIFLQIFNSYYDEDRGQARPISDLRELYLAGKPTDDGRVFAELSEAEQADVIDSKRLAYISDAPVNWCPGLGTVLANEEVTADGKSERGNFPVFKAKLRQWNMRITAYADRLVDDLDRLDWPEPIKLMQRNWIGRSHGAHVDFRVVGASTKVTVFTTRPDTLFGATYLVLAPENPLVDQLVRGAEDEVADYRAQAAAKTEAERQESKDKTGVFIGAHVINPVNDQEIPVYISDYVLMGYGTGAVMGVPGEDQRDYDFAQAHGLPIIRTVQPPDDFVDDRAYTGDGVAINSANAEISLNGLSQSEAKERIIEWLEHKDSGRKTTTYRLRDWLFSRQRYWGEPFPIVFDEHNRPHAIPDHLLPIELPDVPDYSPRTFDPLDATSQPEPPLARVPEWVEVHLDLGDGLKTYRRDTNTMPNWAGSSWYELRYADVTNSDALVGKVNEQYWLGPRGANDPGGVDLYVGGVEHAVLHLLYARFWHKVLFDLGHISSEEPFRRLFNQGYIQAYAYTDARGAYVDANLVEERSNDAGEITFWFEGAQVKREYGKMGKSLKNVVTPDEMYEAYGADTFRLYEMSMGPLDVSRPWETRAVVGSQRFLQRVWRLLVDEQTGETHALVRGGTEEDMKQLHRTIAGVRDDMDGMRFNTAVAKLIEYSNHLTKTNSRSVDLIEPLVLMLAPFAPHIAEEMWSRLGHGQTITFEQFPVADSAYLVDDTVTCVVQVQGKVRATMEVSADAGEAELTEKAMALDNVARAIEGKEIVKVIVKAPTLVNLVVKS